jgi:hypothetical protein
VLVALVSAPRTTLLSLLEAEDRLPKALTFSGVTVALGFLLQAPLARDGVEIMSVGGAMIAYKVIAILVFAGVIMAAFRLVGGTGSFEATLTAYLYVICPLYLALIVLDTVTLGALSSWDREVALGWSMSRSIDEAEIDALFTARPGLAAGVTLLFLAQILTMVIWMLICWRIYRVIHQVGRLRSAVAYLIAFAAVVLLAPVFTLILRGLYAGDLPAIK